MVVANLSVRTEWASSGTRRTTSSDLRVPLLCQYYTSSSSDLRYRAYLRSSIWLLIIKSSALRLRLTVASSCTLPPAELAFPRLRDLAGAGRHSEVLAIFRGALLHPSSLLPFSSVLPAALLSAAALAVPSAVDHLHAFASKSGLLPTDRFVLTALLSAYSRLRLLPLARRLFDEIPAPAPAVAFNAIISGYSLHSVPSPTALSLFRRMRRHSVPFDDVTLLALLPAAPPCAVPALHATAFLSAFTGIPSVGNCFLSCYAKAGALEVARKLFDEMPSHRKDLVSWNTMICGYAQNGLAQQVLNLYNEMKTSSSMEPDEVTFVGVLASCAHLGAHSLGKSIEKLINRNASFASSPYLQNALINLHARSGDLTRARRIFDEMTEKSIVSWTAIIAGYGMHGHGEEALQLFDKMVKEGIKPDVVAMVSVLSACSHAGMADAGMEYFSSMEGVFGLQPKPEHYACMVDLLGRAGRLNEALDLVRSMPVEPDGPVWGALLGACKIHKNVELGELAFEHVVQLEPKNVGYYVLLSNIYSDAGRLDGVAKVRAMMKQRGLKKDPGCSYVELKGKIHLFMADDHSHPQTKKIFNLIMKLETSVKGDNLFDQNRRKDSSCMPLIGYHSEKLAIAFGILNTQDGEEIVVIKNLRVCDNCHIFIKTVSKIINRRFIIRDASRFHHFEGGACSCKDYW